MGAPRKWPNDSSFEDDVDAAVECFKEIKRKYYFENLDGQGLLKLQPEEIRKSMEIFTAFDSQKEEDQGASCPFYKQAVSALV